MLCVWVCKCLPVPAFTYSILQQSSVQFQCYGIRICGIYTLCYVVLYRAQRIL